MKKNYVKKCLMVSLALSMTVATVTFADTLTGDGYANEQETEVYTAGTPDLTTQNETTSEESENPVKHYGWYTDEETGNTYYFDSEGKIQTGWQKINGKWYYMSESGAMVTGWLKITGNWFYFEPIGEMVTGWKMLDGKWYCFTTSGAMLTGTHTIGGKAYTFDASGVWIK